MRIVGLDVGKVSAWSVITDGALIKFGSFHLKKTFPESLKEIDELIPILELFMPIDYIGIELPQPRNFQSNIHKKSIIKLTALTGALIHLAYCFTPRGVIPIWPHEHKGNEPKGVTLNRINMEFGLKIKSDHEADAISVGWRLLEEILFHNRTGMWTGRIEALCL
jgi:hypothetical protein